MEESGLDRGIIGLLGNTVRLPGPETRITIPNCDCAVYPDQ
jgi:hypothetical protein